MTCDRCTFPLPHRGHRRMHPSWLVDDEPDWVVVDRLCSGVVVKSTPAERAAAVRILTARGYDAGLIADRMHCSERLVTRWRARGAA